MKYHSQTSNPRPAVSETAALSKLSYTPVTILYEVPLGRIERPTRGLGIRGSFFLPDLKLKLLILGLKARSFSPPRSQIKKIVKEIRK